MLDRETVIKAIEICYTVGHNCTECPLFNEDGCNDELMRDALALLREQEPVEPITAREGRNKYWSYYVCPNCNEDLNYGQKYCCECGKKVKWDE